MRWEAHNQGMEAFVIVALVGLGLLAAELLLPTGGILALLGMLNWTVFWYQDTGAQDVEGIAQAFLAVFLPQA